jgi:membrane protein YdbS with pleckstrin-like domain
MKQLHPKTIWLFFLNWAIAWTFMSWLVIPLTLIPLVLALSKSSGGEVASTISWVMSFGFLFYAAFLALFYFLAKLTYDNYKYELREDGFRKEHGIIWKKYVTIPYERIQNVDIYRGLLARILGLSDLQIQTAGMSTAVGSYGAGSEGRLPGLDPQEAEKLRDELVKRARGKNQGL